MRTSTRWRVSTLLPVLLLAPAACGTAADQAGSSQLVVTVSDGAGADPRTWTLGCDPPGGDHPDPAAACAALASAPAPFEPVPADAVCTNLYGGPQTATVVGSWRGERVQADYRRGDGCEIARWDAVAALLA